MSRCFPFPPPGYEKNIRADDSLIKEKKKKKERKEKKKDKERSKDKHKERKDKHKDRKSKDRSKEKSSTSEDKKSAGDREKLVINTSESNGNGESKFAQDLARRIRDEEEATKSLPCRVAEKNGSCRVPQTNHRKDDEKRINTPMAKGPENGVLRGSEVMVKTLEKNEQTKKKELQERNRLRESAIKSDNPTQNGGIKESEPNTSSKEKKDEVVIQKNGLEKPNFIEGSPRLKERTNGSTDITKVRLQDLLKAGVKNLSAEGILGKRKDHETNGFLYENGSRPNKIQKPVASPIPSQPNGRKLGSSQAPPKAEVKDHRINGFNDCFIDSQEPKTHPSVSSVKVKENGESSSKKRPHSDLKYLDKLLNVPKREELHENDEQEWLFGQSNVKLLKKESRTDSATSSNETPQVWNQALKLESADIIALPYVVPF